MKLFKKLEEANLANEDLAGRDLYKFEVKTTQRCHLLIKFFDCGGTFRLVPRLMNCTRNETGVS